MPLPSIAPLDLTRLLDTYASGRFDEAMQAIARGGDRVGLNLRAYWSSAIPWTVADPAARPQRLLVAAAMALETEQLRAERGDWGNSSGDVHCVATCVLDWAQERLVERGDPDPAERTWYLAAAALADGVRDWRYLQRPANPRAQPPIPAGLMDRALERFPGDSALRLEQAIAAAGRFSVTTDDVPLLAGTITNLNGMRVVGQPFAAPRPNSRDLAVQLLGNLVNDPIAGVEARIRLGYLEWAMSSDAAAREDLARAAADAKAADDRFLAEFLLGWIATLRGDSAAAIPHLEAALAARPDSQSAAVTLAALTLQQGDASRAYQIAQSSLDHRPTDLDPWRLFLYAHHPRLPDLIAQLRRQVHP